MSYEQQPKGVNLRQLEQEKNHLKRQRRRAAAAAREEKRRNPALARSKEVEVQKLGSRITRVHGDIRKHKKSARSQS